MWTGIAVSASPRWSYQKPAWLGRSGLLHLVGGRQVRRGALLMAEVVVGAVLIFLVAKGLLSAARTSGHGGTFHPAGVALAVGAEVISLVAMAMMPRWLLASQRSRLRRREALAVAMAANAISVAVPGGSVSAPLWAGRQYHRRGATTSASAWTVLAGGFASTVTLIAILIVGLGTAGVLRPVVASGAGAVALILAGALLVLIRRTPARRDLIGSEESRRPGRRGRLVTAAHRVVRQVLEIAERRAGWRRGSGVLGASVVNWLADATALVGAFVAFGVPVPWAGILLAFGAAQAAGALLPLPGGLGIVDGSLFGSLVAVGVAPHSAIAVVALYRIVGYWLPALAGLPAYLVIRRRSADGDRPAPVPARPPDTAAMLVGARAA